MTLSTKHITILKEALAIIIIIIFIAVIIIKFNHTIHNMTDDIDVEYTVSSVSNKEFTKDEYGEFVNDLVRIPGNISISKMANRVISYHADKPIDCKSSWLMDRYKLSILSSASWLQEPLIDGTPRSRKMYGLTYGYIKYMENTCNMELDELATTVRDSIGEKIEYENIMEGNF